MLLLSDWFIIKCKIRRCRNLCRKQAGRLAEARLPEVPGQAVLDASACLPWVPSAVESVEGVGLLFESGTNNNK